LATHLMSRAVIYNQVLYLEELSLSPTKHDYLMSNRCFILDFIGSCRMLFARRRYSRVIKQKNATR
jgi:hypothetical protein